MLAVFYGRKNLSKFRKSAEKLAQKFSLPLKIINVNFGAAAYASNLINDAGPLDFLSLIKMQNVSVLILFITWHLL